MMNPQQPRGIDEKDMERAIDAYTGVDDNFLKKILKGSETRKKAENFLGQQQMMAMHDYQKDPEIIKNIYEVNKALLLSSIDPLFAAIDAILDEIIKLLDDLRGLGFYYLPVHSSSIRLASFTAYLIN